MTTVLSFVQQLTVINLSLILRALEMRATNFGNIVAQVSPSFSIPFRAYCSSIRLSQSIVLQYTRTYPILKHSHESF